MQPLGTLWTKGQTLLSLSTCRISILCWLSFCFSLSLSLSFSVIHIPITSVLFEFSCDFATSSPVQKSFDLSSKIIVSWADKTLKFSLCLLFKTNRKPRFTLAAQLRRRETWLSFYSTKSESDAVDSLFDNHGICILFAVHIGTKKDWIKVISKLALQKPKTGSTWHLFFKNFWR